MNGPFSGLRFLFVFSCLCYLVFCPFEVVVAQSFGVTTPAHGTRPVLTIFWDPHEPGNPPPSQTLVASLLFGNSDSVRDYFLENSYGKFTISNAGFLGWYDALEPWQFYRRVGPYAPPADPADPHHYIDPDGILRYLDDDGFYGGISHGWAEAVRQADAAFDFRHYDLNRDGILTSRELGILILKPGDLSGFRRPIAAREVPRQPLIVDGVQITQIAEVYMGPAVTVAQALGLVAEELGHLFLDIPDLYFQVKLDTSGRLQNFYVPYQATGFSLTAENSNHPHLDAYLKKRLGWLAPRVIVKDGWYSLNDIETHEDALVLVDPNRGAREYFLLENRWPGQTYDALLPDEGLAVWHIIEDPSVYGTVPAPKGVDPDRWATIGVTDWGRRGIRLVKPVYEIPFSASLSVGDFDAGGIDEIIVNSTGENVDTAVLYYDFEHGKDRLSTVKELGIFGVKNRSIRTGNFDGDSSAEVVLAAEGEDGRLAMLLYDLTGPDNVTRVGDVRLPDAVKPFVATGNVDQDDKDEIVLGLTGADGRLAVLIYDVLGSNNLTRVGDLRFAGASDLSLATGNLDQDDKDEIVLGLKGADGRLAVLIYDVLGANNLAEIGDLRFPDASHLSVATSNLDQDDKDEIVLGLKGADGRLAVLIYDVLGANNLARIGDLRFAGASDLSLATGNLDQDDKDEIVLGLTGADGRPAALVYDVLGANNLARIGDLRLPDTSDLSVMTGNFIAQDDKDEIVLGLRAGDGRVALFIYDMLGMNNSQRIGDVRYGYDADTALWDQSDQETGYDLLSSNTDRSKTTLRWADGSSSGFDIKNISAAGPSISVFVDVH